MAGSGEGNDPANDRTIDLSSPDEGSATADLGAPEPTTRPADASSEPTMEQRHPAAADALEDLGAEVRRGVIRNGWDRTSLAALTGFASVLAVGAVLVVMAKLAAPGFGAGKSPWWIMARIGVAGLGALGIPIERGSEGASLLPLGALLFVGLFLGWATKNVVETSGALTLRERVIEGLKVAVPFALACFIAAFVFRLRDRQPSLGADPFWALIIGLLWGAVFGGLGGLRAAGAPDAGRRRLWEAPRPHLRHGLQAGKTMVAALMLLSAVAAIAVVAFKLAFGAPSVSASEAAAFVLALVLFFPNLVLGAAAFCLGGPVGVLARTIGGTRLVSEFSLLGWDAPRPGAQLYLFCLIPVAAFAYGGYHARRNGASAPAEVLGTAAGVVGITVMILVWISRVEVGRAFLGRGNYLVAAAEAPPAGLLGAISAGLFGLLGWWLAGRRAAGGET